jgi:glucose-1-phosphate thymidylyltransferase
VLQDGGWSGREALDLDSARLVSRLSGPGRFSRVTPAGFYLLSGTIAQLAQDLDGNARTLLSALERLLEGGGHVEGVRVKGAWRYGGDPRHLLEGNRYLLERLSAAPANFDFDNVEVQGRVLVDPTADVSDSTIRGPAVVGARARICDAYIGPYTSIGPDVTVEGAEIEHSIVLPGATIAHIGRRLETSIVGTGAKLFRDFRLPNALRVQVGDGAEIALA